MKAVHEKRLLKWYYHLLQPQKLLLHDKFYFGTYENREGCKTLGCIAGELPAVFPKSWYFQNSVLFLKGSSYVPITQDVAAFFDISYVEASHLTIPGQQTMSVDPYYMDHPVLPTTATKAQVVANLRRFLKIKGIL